jgi:hypothetical protein
MPFQISFLWEYVRWTAPHLAVADTFTTGLIMASYLIAERAYTVSRIWSALTKDKQSFSSCGRMRFGSVVTRSYYVGSSFLLWVWIPATVYHSLMNFWLVHVHLRLVLVRRIPQFFARLAQHTCALLVSGAHQPVAVVDVELFHEGCIIKFEQQVDWIAFIILIVAETSKFRFSIVFKLAILTLDL